MVTRLANSHRILTVSRILELRIAHSKARSAHCKKTYRVVTGESKLNAQGKEMEL